MRVGGGYYSPKVSSSGGGNGSGDMTKAVYDPDNDGKVEYAEVADAVAWTGVTGAPDIEAQGDLIEAIRVLKWTEKMILPKPATGYVSPFTTLSRNGTLSAVGFYAHGTPSASTEIKLFHGTGKTLSLGISSSDTAITLGSSITLAFETNMVIDNEVVAVTAIGGTALLGSDLTGTELTILRGLCATSAAAHDYCAEALLQIATATLHDNQPVILDSLSIDGTARDLFAYNVEGVGLAASDVTCVQEWSNR